jgi:ferredoxin
MIEGKAKLLRDDYCDGLGDCLPVCPTGAISFVEREAADYDEEAVKANMEKRRQSVHIGGCPGSSISTFARNESAQTTNTSVINNDSQLMQWPVQLKLVPVNAPYFNGAKLLIAADCTAAALEEIGVTKGQVSLRCLPREYPSQMFTL